MARRTLRYESLESRTMLAADAGILPTDIAAPPEEPAALLVPAVQKVREAAARMNDQSQVPENLGIDSPQPEGILIGLLLPAVQKVNEAAGPVGPTNPTADDLGVETPEPEVLIGLLLPAVQKVREAAANNDVPTDLSSGDDDGEGLLLPAVQKVREAAARMKCSNSIGDEPGDDTGLIDLLRTGEDDNQSETYLEYKLENVLISSYQTGGSAAAADEFFTELEMLAGDGSVRPIRGGDLADWQANYGAGG